MKPEKQRIASFVIRQCGACGKFIKSPKINPKDADIQKLRDALKGLMLWSEEQPDNFQNRTVYNVCKQALNQTGGSNE